jgi:hypothetical protein
MIHEFTCHTVKCDGCGKDFYDGAEVGGYTDEDYVLNELHESAWETVEVRHTDPDYTITEFQHYCPTCTAALPLGQRPVPDIDALVRKQFADLADKTGFIGDDAYVAGFIQQAHTVLEEWKGSEG